MWNPFRRIRKTVCFGPKDFRIKNSGWEGRGVLANFDDLHGLNILVADGSEKYSEEKFMKEWFSDADEVLFRRGKRIMLYWSKQQPEVGDGK